MSKTLASISLVISIVALPQIASCASSEEDTAAIRQVVTSIRPQNTDQNYDIYAIST